tara:strand:- start:1377 stop:1628 length:252 start_codon:yes stop_codon:yes gene_type:complete
VDKTLKIKILLKHRVMFFWLLFYIPLQNLPALFLKHLTALPLSEVTGRRSKPKKRTPDLNHEITTSVEGEALWLSELTLTSRH